MRIEIYISPKKSVLDPQGLAVEQALVREGFEGIGGCRVGKIITLDLPHDTASLSQDALDKHIAAMCEAVLVNPIVETFTYKIVGLA